LAAIEGEILLAEQKQRNINKARLDDQYRSICKEISKGGNADANYEIIDNRLS
jgi:hypothetical protein